MSGGNQFVDHKIGNCVSGCYSYQRNQWSGGLVCLNKYCSASSFSVAVTHFALPSWQQLQYKCSVNAIHIMSSCQCCVSSLQGKVSLPTVSYVSTSAVTPAKWKGITSATSVESRTRHRNTSPYTCEVIQVS